MTRHLSITRFVSPLLLAATAHAAAITVNNLADGSVAGACTLRDAIAAANTHAVAAGCAAGAGADTINFTVSGTITLASPLVVNPGSSITINGAGQSITLSGNSTVGIIQNLGTLQLQFLNVINGGPIPIAASFGTLSTGAIANQATLGVSNCSFLHNGANGLNGGAIYNDEGATSTISDSTFSGNTGLGGATLNNGTMTISNSTFTGNQGSEGGAIFNAETLTLVNSTVSGNSAPRGSAISNRGTLNLSNTILANSTSGGDCFNGFSSSPGTINTSGVNLVMDGSCSIAGALSGDPLLGPLSDNGGTTQTMALLAGSPAIDTANDTICAASPVNNLDQRGQPRSTDGKCDIGAYETPTPFTFTGFLAPLSNLPTVNVVKAGRSVPIQFSLGGNQGLGIFASGYPQVQQVTCSTGAPTDVVDGTVTSGNSSLSYDSTTNTYTYVWKTQSNWSNTCQQFVIRLTDGSYHVAEFQFR